jgi:hypothetical protein
MNTEIGNEDHSHPPLHHPQEALLLGGPVYIHPSLPNYSSSLTQLAGHCRQNASGVSEEVEESISISLRANE